MSPKKKIYRGVRNEIRMSVVIKNNRLLRYIIDLNRIMTYLYSYGFQTR